VFDREPVTAQDLGDPSRGALLLEGRLGIRVDPMAQIEELVARAIDGGRDPALGGFVGTRRSDAGERPVGAAGASDGFGESFTRPPRSDRGRPAVVSAPRTGRPRRG